MPALRPVVAAAVLCAVAACSTSPTDRPATDAASSAGVGAASELPCAAAVDAGPLPTWARDGFTPPDQPVPHVVGTRGEIVGVLFGQPLSAPPAQGRVNKILWVAKPGATADSGDSLGTELTIQSRLNGVGATATTTIAGGPGPSVVDLPAAGCWTVTLTWSGRTDTVALRYTG